MLTSSLWLLYFRSAQRLGLHVPGTRLALQLLACPDGLPSEALAGRPTDVHRLSCWTRRREPWVRVELVRYEADGTRRVRYHATPAFHAALPVPPSLAAPMHRHLEAWFRILADAGIDQHPLRLLCMLLAVSAAPIDAGFPEFNKEHRTVPWLCVCTPYAAYWRTLTANGLVRRVPGKPARYFLRETGRRILGLPGPPLMTVQPYTNRCAA